MKAVKLLAKPAGPAVDKKQWRLFGALGPASKCDKPYSAARQQNRF
jgi:hypothetical protein